MAEPCQPPVHSQPARHSLTVHPPVMTQRCYRDSNSLLNSLPHTFSGFARDPCGEIEVLPITQVPSSEFDYVTKSEEHLQYQNKHKQNKTE